MARQAKDENPEKGVIIFSLAQKGPKIIGRLEEKSAALPLGLSGRDQFDYRENFRRNFLTLIQI